MVNKKSRISLVDVNQPYYHGVLSNEEVSQLLHSEDIGTYVLRDSTKGGGYSLLVKRSDKSIRFFLDYNAQENYFLTATNEKFYSIDDLLEYLTRSIGEVEFKNCLEKKDVALQCDYSDLKQGTVLRFVCKKLNTIICKDKTTEEMYEIPSKKLYHFIKHCELRCISDGDNTGKDCRIIRQRNPSHFLTDHMRLEVGQKFQIKKNNGDGFYLLENSQGVSALAPCSYLEIVPRCILNNTLTKLNE